MTKNLVALAALAAVATMGATRAAAQDAIDTSDIKVKKAIADTMTPEQLQAYKERLAQRRAAGIFDRAPGRAAGRTPGDTCSAATYELGALPYPPAPANDTTVGAADNFDLPPDTVAPTCTASTSCTGAGPAGSLPRGAIYTGTGTAPDRAWRIRTDANCNLTINMDPAAQDLALIVYQATCSNLLSDCVCVDDTGVAGAAESVLLNAVSGTDYFVVVDGYSTGGTPPGPSDAYTLQITGTGCNLVPVELQSIAID